MMLMNENFRQLLRYSLVGLSLNATAYMGYLILTSFYITPFSAVFLIYPLSVFVGFFAHRGLTFKSSSEKLSLGGVFKYVFLYVMGFFLNWIILYVFFEKLGYPHQLVQLASIFILAGFLFVSMKLIVFPAKQDQSSRVA